MAETRSSHILPARQRRPSAKSHKSQHGSERGHRWRRLNELQQIETLRSGRQRERHIHLGSIAHTCLLLFLAELRDENGKVMYQNKT